jgi:hypothetical protein
MTRLSVEQPISNTARHTRPRLAKNLHLISILFYHGTQRKYSNYMRNIKISTIFLTIILKRKEVLFN